MAARDDSWIGGQHAIDVGPDLNFLGIHSGAHDGGRIIGPAAPERCGVAIFGGSDETAHHDDGALSQRLHFFLQRRVGFFQQGLSVREFSVGKNDAARIDVLAFESAGAKGEADYQAR